MGEVIAFPGVAPPEPEPEVSFDEWRDNEVADTLGEFDALAEAPDRESFEQIAREVRARIDSWVGG